MADNNKTLIIRLWPREEGTENDSEEESQEDRLLNPPEFLRVLDLSRYTPRRYLTEINFVEEKKIMWQMGLMWDEPQELKRIEQWKETIGPMKAEIDRTLPRNSQKPLYFTELLGFIDRSSLGNGHDPRARGHDLPDADLVCGSFVRSPRDVDTLREALEERGMPADAVHVSLERNMHCGVKLCGFDVGLERPLFLIAGPDTLESEQLCLDVAGRLKEAKDRLASDLLVVMRVYFEKPRTTVGWKGLINDPDLDGSFDVAYSCFSHHHFPDPAAACREAGLSLHDVGLTFGRFDRPVGAVGIDRAGGLVDDARLAVLLLVARQGGVRLDDVHAARRVDERGAFGADLFVLGLKHRPAFGIDQPDFASSRGQALIGVILSQEQAVLAARGQHPVGLRHALQDEVVHHHADIGIGAIEQDWSGASGPRWQFRRHPSGPESRGPARRCDA